MDVKMSILTCRGCSVARFPATDVWFMLLLVLQPPILQNLVLHVPNIEVIRLKIVELISLRLNFSVG